MNFSLKLTNIVVRMQLEEPYCCLRWLPVINREGRQTVSLSVMRALVGLVIQTWVWFWRFWHTIYGRWNACGPGCQRGDLYIYRVSSAIWYGSTLSFVQLRSRDILVMGCGFASILSAVSAEARASTHLGQASRF